MEAYRAAYALMARMDQLEANQLLSGVSSIVNVLVLLVLVLAMVFRECARLHEEQSLTV